MSSTGYKDLRQRLIELGETPGPITATTYTIYRNRLLALEKTSQEMSKPTKKSNKNIVAKVDKQKETSKNDKRYQQYPQEENQQLPEISHSTSSLKNVWNLPIDFTVYRKLEQEAFCEFVTVDPLNSYTWREGVAKRSFNYLLLDPRCTKNLPNRSYQLSEPEAFAIFLSSIFYVGKGKFARSFDHLDEASLTWHTRSRPKGKKIQRIIDIWSSKKGVIMLVVFNTIIPVEGYTREAAMIDAIGVERLTNEKRGHYYGKVDKWSDQKKIELGSYLLYKAMKIFMYDGERQIFPHHVK